MLYVETNIFTGVAPEIGDLLAATSQLARGWLPRSSRTCLLLLVWSLTTCWRGTGNTDNFPPTMISHAFMHFVLRSKNWRWPRWPTDHQQCKVRRLTLGIHRLSPPYFNAQRSLLYCPGMVQNAPTAAVSFWLWHAIWLGPGAPQAPFPATNVRICQKMRINVRKRATFLSDKYAELNVRMAARMNGRFFCSTHVPSFNIYVICLNLCQDKCHSKCQSTCRRYCLEISYARIHVRKYVGSEFRYVRRPTILGIFFFCWNVRTDGHFSLLQHIVAFYITAAIIGWMYSNHVRTVLVWVEGWWLEKMLPTLCLHLCMR